MSMGTEMNFQSWCKGPAKHLLQGVLGFNIDRLLSWQDYTENLGRFFEREGCCDDLKSVPNKVRERFAVMSSGEQVLFAACLCAADFAWLADELMGDRTWQRVWWDLSGDHRTSVGAAIARID
jgi:hypothetical protein